MDYEGRYTLNIPVTGSLHGSSLAYLLGCSLGYLLLNAPPLVEFRMILKDSFLPQNEESPEKKQCGIWRHSHLTDRKWRLADSLLRLYCHVCPKPLDQRIYKKSQNKTGASHIVKCDKRHQLVASITETLNVEVAK